MNNVVDVDDLVTFEQEEANAEQRLECVVHDIKM